MSGKTPKKSAEVARQAGAKLTLLADGNPQIAKAAGDAPVQAYTAVMPGWKCGSGRCLDALILRNVPNVRKTVRWNSPFQASRVRAVFGLHVFTIQSPPASLPSYSNSYGFGSPSCEVRSILVSRQRNR